MLSVRLRRDIISTTIDVTVPQKKTTGELMYCETAPRRCYFADTLLLSDTEDIRRVSLKSF